MLVSTILHTLFAKKIIVWVVPLLAVSGGVAAGFLTVPGSEDARGTASVAAAEGDEDPLVDLDVLPAAKEPGAMTAPCPESRPRLVVEPPFYIGAPILFRLEDVPCLVSWSIDLGDGTIVEARQATVEHAFASRGSYQVRFEARVGGDLRHWGDVRVNVVQYHPPLEPWESPWGNHSHLEAPLFARSNISYYWYLDNGLDWYNRPYSQLSWNLWAEGLGNRTYLHGAGGVTLHVLPLFDGRLFTGATPHAKAWIMKAEANPSNEVPPCQGGYVADMPSYAITDLAPLVGSGWGFRSRVMGCGHDVFVPEKTDVGFCIEWDGELLAEARPYLDGFIVDACDVEMATRM